MPIRERISKGSSFFIQKKKRQKTQDLPDVAPRKPGSARERIRREAMEHNRSFLSEQQKDTHTTISEIASIQRELGVRRGHRMLQEKSRVRDFGTASDGDEDDSNVLNKSASGIGVQDGEEDHGVVAEARLVHDLFGRDSDDPDDPDESSMDIDATIIPDLHAIDGVAKGAMAGVGAGLGVCENPNRGRGRGADSGIDEGVLKQLREAIAKAPQPWVDSCIELDEMRGRIPPPPLEISVLAPHHNADTGDDLGRETEQASKLGDVDDEPSTDGVICQIQNWVVRLDCIIETLSVQKAFRQATNDMRERHGLRKWAKLVKLAEKHPEREQYDVWYMKQMAQCNGVRDWRAVMKLSPEGGRPDVPVWARNATHVADLVRRIKGSVDRVPVTPEAARRPALNLHSLVYSFLPRGGRYDTNNFSALKCPNMSPRATCLIYSSTRAQSGSRASARAVCTGAKTPEEVSWSLHKLMRALEESGSLPLTVDWRTYKVSNVVASVILLSYTVNLKELDRQCGMQCSYNPSMFPAAILRLRQDLGRVAVLVYSTKLVIAGSKSKKILTRTLRTAIRVTWRARHTNLKGEGARTMLRPHERVFKELLADRRRGMPENATPWGIAIRGTRVSMKAD